MIDSSGEITFSLFSISPWGLGFSLLFLTLALYYFLKKGPHLQVPSLSPLTLRKTPSIPWSKIPLGAFILTLSLLLLDPLWIKKSISSLPLPTSGKTWTLLLDRSGSMWRTLPLPNGEIEPLVKYVADLFAEQVQKREGDLVALVAFARKPDILLPLTPDRIRLKKILETLQKVPPEQDGTSITYSIYKSLLMIEEAKEKESTFHLDRNTLILVTDGFETLSDEDAKDPLIGISLDKVLDKAKKLGVHIYVVSLFPTKDNLLYGPEIRRLQQIGRATHGGFFQATPEGLEDLFKQIDHGEGGALAPQVPPKQFGVPLAPYLALIALGCLFIYLLIREVLYLTLP